MTVHNSDKELSRFAPACRATYTSESTTESTWLTGWYVYGYTSSMLSYMPGFMLSVTTCLPASIAGEMHCEFLSEKQMAQVQALDNVFAHSGAYIRLNVICIDCTTQNTSIFQQMLSCIFVSHKSLITETSINDKSCRCSMLDNTTN